MDFTEQVTDPEGQEQTREVRQDWPGQAGHILGSLGGFPVFITMGSTWLWLLLLLYISHKSGAGW